MNILVINYEYPPVGGGAATFTRYLVEALSDRNHRISVLTSKYGNLPTTETIGEGINIYRVPSFRKSICECSLIGMLSFVVFGMLKVRHVVRELKPDICLNFFAQPCGMIALYANHRFGIPYVLCLRGGDVPGFSPEETRIYHAILSPLSRRVWDDAAAITAASKGLRTLAQKFYAKKDIHVIPNATDTRLFRPLELTPPQETFNLLFVGRLTVQKNLIWFFEKVIPALTLNDTERKLRLTIVGDGPVKGRLIKIAKKCGFLESVDFIDWVDRRQLPLIYNANDILVLPSFFEGMSNVVLEAKACGLRVAGFNIPGNEDLLETGRDLIVDRRNREAFARELIGMMNQNPKPKNRTSRSFVSRFGLNHVVDHYLELISQVRQSAVSKTRIDPQRFDAFLSLRIPDKYQWRQ